MSKFIAMELRTMEHHLDFMDKHYTVPELYNHKEIAEILGWSQGSTRNLLYRGLADLRGDLSGRLEVFQ